MKQEIHIIGRDIAEAPALVEALKVVMRFSETATHSDIIVNKRRADGWLEYGINVFNLETNQRLIYIGLIQRRHGAEFETHS